jgi:hypothetical protein
MPPAGGGYSRMKSLPAILHKNSIRHDLDAISDDPSGDCSASWAASHRPERRCHHRIDQIPRQTHSSPGSERFEDIVILQAKGDGTAGAGDRATRSLPRCVIRVPIHDGSGRQPVARVAPRGHCKHTAGGEHDQSGSSFHDSLPFFWIRSPCSACRAIA